MNYQRTYLNKGTKKHEIYAYTKTNPLFQEKRKNNESIPAAMQFDHLGCKKREKNVSNYTRYGKKYSVSIGHVSKTK